MGVTENGSSCVFWGLSLLLELSSTPTAAHTHAPEPTTHPRIIPTKSSSRTPLCRHRRVASPSRKHPPIHHHLFLTTVLSLPLSMMRSDPSLPHTPSHPDPLPVTTHISVIPLGECYMNPISVTSIHLPKCCPSRGCTAVCSKEALVLLVVSTKRVVMGLTSR